MIVRDGKRFNCCESALMMIDEGHPLPGFEFNVMKAASSLGGGVGGWGSACGAATGAVIALGLVHGTNGEENPEEFQERRGHLREMSQEFLKEFEDAFGSLNCMTLLGVDRRTEEGKARYKELKAQGLFKCDDYVDWAVKLGLEILDKD
jgi:C_GCAxxG_C_C family probable redox protein